MARRSEQIASLVIFCSVLVLQGGINRERLMSDFIPEPARIAQFSVAPVAVKAAAAEEPSVSAVAAIAIDDSSAALLYQKNAQQVVSPASTTKLMTAVVARQVYASGTLMTVPNLRGLSGNMAGLAAGEQLSLESLLEAALIPSGNDAALTIAQNYPAGEAAFIAAMNQKAEQLHMTKTKYQNSVGFDDPNQQTTAFDLALLGREALKDPLLARIVSTKNTTVLDLTGRRKHTLQSTNQLLLTDPRVVGIKTGTTDEAGEVLISKFVLETGPVTVVVMGSQDRYQDTRMIINWITENYTWREVE